MPTATIASAARVIDQELNDVDNRSNPSTAIVGSWPTGMERRAPDTWTLRQRNRPPVWTLVAVLCAALRAVQAVASQQGGPRIAPRFTPASSTAWRFDMGPAYGHAPSGATVAYVQAESGERVTTWRATFVPGDGGELVPTVWPM